MLYVCKYMSKLYGTNRFGPTFFQTPFVLCLTPVPDAAAGRHPAGFRVRWPCSAGSRNEKERPFQVALPVSGPRTWRSGGAYRSEAGTMLFN